jgi:hypothetical protein
MALRGIDYLRARYQQQRVDSAVNALTGGDRHASLPPNLNPRPGEHPGDFLARSLPGLLIPRAPHHNALWDWAAALREGEMAQSRVEMWGRGQGKSTMAEQIAAYLACSLGRRFALYVCGSQDQANLHVQSIAAILESMGVPRALNLYSSSVGWSAQKLQTSNGFGVVGVGLNGRIRGARLGQFRPDLIIVDDIDEATDSQAMIAKKLGLLSKAVFPAGSQDAVVLFVQNRVHKDSVMAKTFDGRAEILLGATKTRVDAAQGLEVERYTTDDGPRYRVVAGLPAWPEGQGLAVIEAQINKWQLPAFLQESQNEDAPDGGLWNMERDIEPYRVAAAPPTLARIVIGVDPSGSLGTEAGVVAVGKSHDGHYYVLADDSLAGTTDQWVRAAIARYHALKADTLVVERNYGGDIVRAAIRNADPRVGVIEVVSTRGKLVRAEPVHQLYQQGVVHHVGRFIDMEKELCTWVQGMASPNRLDALVFGVAALMEPAAQMSITSYRR